LIDVDSTQRIPCAAARPWELSDLVADLSLDDAELDSVTLVRAPARGPSWVPPRRSELPAVPECPTLRQEIPRELLRMTELHDTEECPIADLSGDDVEWLDD
jgi:hypothetical protein